MIYILRLIKNTEKKIKKLKIRLVPTHRRED
jgi:hypothetical protein